MSSDSSDFEDELVDDLEFPGENQSSDDEPLNISISATPTSTTRSTSKNYSLYDMSYDSDVETGRSNATPKLQVNDGSCPKVGIILRRMTMKFGDFKRKYGNINTHFIKNGSRFGWDMETDDETEVTMLFIKWADLSYIHCSWELPKKLEDREGNNMKQKLNRYNKHELEYQFQHEDFPYHQSEYLEIDRILDMRTIENEDYKPPRPKKRGRPKKKKSPKSPKSLSSSSSSTPRKRGRPSKKAKLNETDECDNNKKEKMEEEGEEENKEENKNKNVKIEEEEEDDDDDEIIIRKATPRKSKVIEEEEEEDFETEEDDEEEESSETTPNIDENYDISPTIDQYLVKWESLPYKDSTWEYLSDLKQCDKYEHPIEVYHNNRKNKSKVKFHNSDWRPHADVIAKTKILNTYKNGNELRNYQYEGIKWLVWNWIDNRNCILADEMGLGKTIQSICYIQNLYTLFKIPPPYLIIVPLSTLPNWKREIEEWSDFYSVTYHGDTLSRGMIHQYEWLDDQGKPLFDICLTTPEICKVSESVFQQIKWSVMIIDEAHKLKSINNKTRSTIISFEASSIVLLTGTPIQNDTTELFSLLNIIDPNKFDDLDSFQEQFGNLKDASQVNDLHTALKGYFLRRMKGDVETKLLPKQETIIEVELTTIQKRYYRAIYEKNAHYLYQGMAKNAVPSLMNVMLQLRKLCNHPYLINGIEEKILQEESVNENDENFYEKSMDVLIKTSGKMVLLEKLLSLLKEQGHRILLFSQMVRMLDIIQDYLIYKGYKYERFDGTSNTMTRQNAIDRFSRKDSDIFIFLISTKAGGIGINLTAADTVIEFDSDWNPQNDIQAQARCHRIGQTKSVKIYRFITSKTYEQQMFDRASKKLGLDKAVLHNIEEGKSKDLMLSKKDMENLLKYGAYHIFQEEKEGISDKESKSFMEADIEDILKNRTQTVQLGKDSESLFSKASFVSNTLSDEIDIDDPDFWRKYTGIEDTYPPEVLLIDGGSNRRTTRNSMGLTPSGLLDSEYGENGENGDEIGEDGEHHFTRNFDRDDLIEGYGNLRWSKSDRDKVISGLQQYGFGKWAEIQNLGSIYKRHSIQEVTELCVHIISQWVRVYNIVKTTPGPDLDQYIKSGIGSASTARREALAAIIERRSEFPILDYIHPEITRNNGNDDDIKKEKPKREYKRVFSNYEPVDLSNHTPHVLLKDSVIWKRWFTLYNKDMLVLSTLHDIRVIADELELYKPENRHKIIPLKGNINIPYKWWKKEDDYSLFVGCCKYGWNCVLEIMKDPELYFRHFELFVDDKIKEDDEEGSGNVAGEETEEGGGEENKEIKKETKVKEEEESTEMEIEEQASSSTNDKSSGQASNPTKNAILLAHPDWPKFTLLARRLIRLLQAYQRNNVNSDGVIIGRKNGVRLNGGYSSSSSSKTKNVDVGSRSTIWSKNEFRSVLNTLESYSLPENHPYKKGDPLKLDVTQFSINNDEFVNVICGEVLSNCVNKAIKAVNPEIKSPNQYTSCELGYHLLTDPYGPYHFLYSQGKFYYKPMTAIYLKYLEMERYCRYLVVNRITTSNTISRSRDSHAKNTSNNTPDRKKSSTETPTLSQAETPNPSQTDPTEKPAPSQADLAETPATSQVEPTETPSESQTQATETLAVSNETTTIIANQTTETTTTNQAETTEKTEKIETATANQNEIENQNEIVNQTPTETPLETPSLTPPLTPNKVSKPRVSKPKTKKENKKDTSSSTTTTTSNNNNNNQEELTVTNFISYHVATRIVDQMELLNILRKNILPAGEQNVKNWIVRINRAHPKQHEEMPEGWNPEVHDYILFLFLEQFGSRNLSDLKKYKEFRGFLTESFSADAYHPSSNVRPLTDTLLMKRAKFLLRILLQSSPWDDPNLMDEENIIIVKPHISYTTENQNNIMPEKQLSREEIYEKCKKQLEKTKLPVQCKGLTIISLGYIDTRRSYYNDKYIWPVGFISERETTSYIDATSKTIYRSEICDGGDNGPLFKVTAEDDPTHPSINKSCSASWVQILIKIKKAKSKIGINKAGTSISGPETFGFAQPFIAELIEGLPGAIDCKYYTFREERFYPTNNIINSNKLTELSSTDSTVEATKRYRRSTTKYSSSYLYDDDENEFEEEPILEDDDDNEEKKKIAKLE